MADLLEVEDLRTQIHLHDSTVRAVDGVSLTVKAGETVGLVGESGCGKSMTGMSVMRLLPPRGRIVSGSVRLTGRELTSLPEAEMRRVRGNEVAMVFQDPMTSLNPTMTIGAQIAEAVQAHRDVTRQEGIERAAAVLELVGMPRPAERLRAYPHHLSGGLRQRVLIAMALACEPKLLIADEPTTALDVTIQRQILTLLDDLKERLHMGMLFITHDMGVIAGRADRVVIMYAGKIVESADTGTLFGRMRHPYTQALLASIPTLETDRRQTLYSIPGRPPDLAVPQSGCRFASRCRMVRDRCRVDEPALEEREPGHAFACFYPVSDPLVAGSRAGNGANPPGDLSNGSRSQAQPQPAAGTTADHPAACAEGLSQEPLLVLDHVVKDWPVLRGALQRQTGSVKAVSDVSLEVARGETFGLVGESGCGKTTLGRMIVALERPDSGAITFDGQDVTKLRGAQLRRKRRDLQLMFQDPYASLDPRMRVAGTLREPLVSQHIGTRKEQQARIRELLTDVGLPGRAMHLYPHEFSGGQRQRIGFARALIVRPRLIVADEPVSALDVSIRSQVLNLMKRLQAERNLTYIIISHDLSVVRYMADRIGVMYLGKLVEIGSSDEIYQRPAHPYTVGLLQAIPQFKPRAEGAEQQDAVRGELPSAVTPPSGCRFRTRCPRAAEMCADQEPPLRSFNLQGHLAACHFPLQQPLEASLRP